MQRNQKILRQTKPIQSNPNKSHLTSPDNAHVLQSTIQTNENKKNQIKSNQPRKRKIHGRPSPFILQNAQNGRRTPSELLRQLLPRHHRHRDAGRFPHFFEDRAESRAAVSGLWVFVAGGVSLFAFSFFSLSLFFFVFFPPLTFFSFLGKCDFGIFAVCSFFCRCFWDGRERMKKSLNFSSSTPKKQAEMCDICEVFFYLSLVP